MSARIEILKQAMKCLLNVGGGSKAIPIPSYYQGWQHTLLDVDPRSDVDIALDARLLRTLPPAIYDAVFCAHNLEHYHRHDGLEVLRGMHHVLKTDGFLEIRVPDVGEVMRLVVDRQLDLDDMLYQSLSGPIMVRDVFWGYHVEIERSGQDHFAHKTGFTPKSLIKFVSAVGFPVHAMRQQNLEIVAIFFKQPPTEEQKRLLDLKYSK